MEINKHNNYAKYINVINYCKLELLNKMSEITLTRSVQCYGTEMSSLVVFKNPKTAETSCGNACSTIGGGCC